MVQEFLLSTGNLAGLLFGQVADREEVEHLMRLLADAFLFFGHGGAVEPRVQQRLALLAGGNHHQVLEAGHRPELMRDLEGSEQALVEQLVRGKPGDVFAIHEHPARSGRQAACDDVEERGLSRPVGADETRDASCADFQRGPIDGTEAAEMPVQVFDNDHVILSPVSRRFFGPL